MATANLVEIFGPESNWRVEAWWMERDRSPVPLTPRAILAQWEAEIDWRRQRAGRHWSTWSLAHSLAYKGELFEPQPLPRETRRFRRWWRQQRELGY